jgi:GNAT superfamily N-acetyltransferase
VRYAVLGSPDDGPTLRLDWEAFSYAGKFVMSNTGKAIAYEGAPIGGRDGWPPAARDTDEFLDDVVGAVSFNADRTDDRAAWLRYVTVREDRRGDGIGARLCAFTSDHLLGERDADEATRSGFDTVRIAVNNPFAYEALHKAGFGFTGEETGLAELVLERPCEDRAVSYQSGFDRYRERDLSAAERAFLDRKRGASPPPELGD